MRLRRSRGFHGLKRPKLRQSWNKFNLYNLSRFRGPVMPSQTYFQQKWKSKSTTRKYHGETVGEKKWQRMFRPLIRSVVPMDPQQLARGDGREQAAGRGSGLERLKVRGQHDKREVRPTPYMHMVYAQLERRLDTAIFRALFASSTRQARQFCVHGAVRVNGKKMVYPGYRLNPGDMFQVDPERVMHATGAPKDRIQRRLGRKVKDAREKGGDESLTYAKKKNKQEDTPAEAEAEAKGPAEESLLTDNKTVLSQLLTAAKSFTGSTTISTARQKQDLRTFTRLVRSTLSRANQNRDINASTSDQLSELMTKLNITVETSRGQRERTAPPSTAAAATAAAPASEDGRMRPVVPTSETQMIKSFERKQLELALAEARDNPVDAAKPYATPWRPRPWMSAFAFVPRYLEVHHRICSAVYLRHPVARPGLAEVPTPFDGELLGLSFNWYLRRR